MDEHFRTKLFLEIRDLQEDLSEITLRYERQKFMIERAIASNIRLLYEGVEYGD